MTVESRSDSYALIFSALAHPARRRILISLNFAGGVMSAGAIAGLFGHSWPTTTRHLQQLEAAGLLSLERHGRCRHYRLTARPLNVVADWLSWFSKDPVTAEDKRDAFIEPEHRNPPVQA